ncbi:hypothetical protein CDD83_9517 [Cordyceps sp. RAO-2017]|nr:hypothetical protein CDD83_9517 [Cordyceps sp. RAO-2017]
MGVMWSPGDKTSEGRKWATYLVLVAVLDGLGTGAGRYLLERVGQAWVDSIRVEALARILQQPKHWFDRTSHSPGRINECLERNAEEMRCIVGRFVPIVVFVFAIMSTSILWALAVSWRLTLVSLAPLPLVMGAMSGYAAVSSRWESRCNAGAEESNEAMTEILLNIRVVRALNQGAHFEEKFRESTRRTLRLGLERAKRTSCLFGLYQSMSFALTALVFYYGTVLLAKEDDVDVLGVLQVINLLLFSIGTSASVLDGIPQLTLAQAAAVELLKYANLPLNKPKPGRSAKKVHSPLPLQTRGLTFSYPGRPADAVLRGVSLEVWPGECTAIVGQSGCGKSTVASILVGLYAPLEARDVEKLPCLSYAGVSFSNVDIEQLRSTMAYVPQSPFVFPASVVENIAYGLAPDSPYRRGTCVVQAAQAAGLHDFIVSLPQGYNTPVGDGGQALSGGQAQRLSIARALVRQPRLLVMDEPTSALDADSAQTIRQTVRRLVRSGTAWQRDVAVVVVTHSREMMQAADRIVVLESGAKVEEGSYGGLVQRKGPFLQLVSGGQWMGDEGETA